MQVISGPLEFQAWCRKEREQGQRIGLVPTMGALHEGHFSLIEGAKRASCVPVVTLFVNPKQFGPNEDLDNYPRTLEADLAGCKARGVQAVFTPAASAMYLKEDATTVSVERLTAGLCGAVRPGHFDGVTTVVCKLLNLAGECSAFFGRKDYQQLKVIERMCADLFLPVRVVPMPIFREPDGLAMSSRNRYLSPEERSRALSLSRALTAAARKFDVGERRASELRLVAQQQLSEVKQDYVSLVDPDSLAPLEERVGERALLALAAFVGPARLIDNMLLGEELPPLEETS